MKFVIIGKQGAGKSTFGRAFAKAWGTEFHETSEWLVECETRRTAALKKRYNLVSHLVNQDTGIGIENPWDTKRNRPCRELLVALGDAVNLLNPTFLPDRCFEKGDICAGTRRRSEFEALVKKYKDELVVIYIYGREGPDTNIDNFELELDFVKSLCPRVYTVDSSKSTLETVEAFAEQVKQDIIMETWR